MKTLTAEKFAEWSFENDQKKRLYSRSQSFSTLPALERELYLDEARAYLSGNVELGLPDDIIDRAKREGYTIKLPG